MKKQLEHHADIDISTEESSNSMEILKSKKVAIFIVAFNSEKFIKSVIERIPANLMSYFAEIFVIDDSSTDLTYEVATG
jgi:hypothetical protein